MEPAFMDVLIFEIDGQRHGLPAADVQELLAALLVMPLPGAPDGIEGVINLRGEIVPVLDVRKRFGMATKPVALADHFIVVRTSDRALALHVDRAVELARLDAGALAALETQTTRVAKHGDAMVLLHRVQDFSAEASP
jgi:purine-binding chemotaxis protein CheW